MMPNNAGVGVVIPALDEAGNIGAVVSAVLAAGFDLVVVADNGSADETAAEASTAGALVVSEPTRGYGRACATGGDLAIAEGATIVVYMDGDGSCRASEITMLVAPILAGEADLVLGSRTAGVIEAGAMPSHQRFGNWLTARITRLLYGLVITDTGPFRAIDSGLLGRLDMSEMTFGWPTEMMVKAARRDARIVEVPVSWDKRVSGASKVGGSLKGSVLAGWQILRVTARYAVTRSPSR